MTSKERKQVKHTLKTNIDKADNWIQLAAIGNSLGANSQENAVETSKTRKTIVDELNRLKAEISGDTEKFIATIDEVIRAIS